MLMQHHKSIQHCLALRHIFNFQIAPRASRAAAGQATPDNKSIDVVTITCQLSDPTY